MKSCVITRHGGPDVIELKEQPSPKLHPTGLRIQVAACGVNFADIMMREGLYPEAPKPPFTPGYEIAGVVRELGAEARKFKVGDRVLAGCRFGGYTSEYVADESGAWKIPDHLSFEEAAAIPVNFITAWMALEEMGRVRRGDRVLIQSAAGGVGVAAVQLAARAGAAVTGLVGSSKKAQAVMELGAKSVILNSEWDQGTDRDHGGYDIILDATGGESLKRSFRRLAPTGRVVSFGASAMVAGEKRSLFRAVKTLVNSPLFTPFKLMMENKGVYGLNVLKLFQPENQPRVARAFDRIIEGFEKRELRAIVGKTFPLAQAGEAQQYLRGRTNIGKVVLTPQA